MEGGRPRRAGRQTSEVLLGDCEEHNEIARLMTGWRDFHGVSGNQVLEQMTPEHFAPDPMPKRTALYKMFKGKKLTLKFAEAVADICSTNPAELAHRLEQTRALWQKSQSSPTTVPEPEEELLEVQRKLITAQEELLRFRELYTQAKDELERADHRVGAMMVLVMHLQSQITMLTHEKVRLLATSSTLSELGPVHTGLEEATRHHTTAEAQLERAQADRAEALELASRTTIRTAQLQEEVVDLRLAGGLDVGDELVEPLPPLPSLSRGPLPFSTPATNIGAALDDIRGDMDGAEEVLRDVREQLGSAPVPRQTRALPAEDLFADTAADVAEDTDDGDVRDVRDVREHHPALGDQEGQEADPPAETSTAPADKASPDTAGTQDRGERTAAARTEALQAVAQALLGLARSRIGRAEAVGRVKGAAAKRALEGVARVKAAEEAVARAEADAVLAQSDALRWKSVAAAAPLNSATEAARLAARAEAYVKKAAAADVLLKAAKANLKDAEQAADEDPAEAIRINPRDTDLFQCFSHIVRRQTTWNYVAVNRSTGTRGVVQALPGWKMALYATNWRADPRAQITWGPGDTISRRTRPFTAWSFQYLHNH